MATLMAGYFHASVLAICVLYAVALVVGITRIYVGAHYPRDVLAGAILGSAWGLLGAIVESAYIRHGGTTMIHYIGLTSMKKPHIYVPPQHPRLKLTGASISTAAAANAPISSVPLQTPVNSARPTGVAAETGVAVQVSVEGL